jgi:hypothetical protein
MLDYVVDRSLPTRLSGLNCEQGDSHAQALQHDVAAVCLRQELEHFVAHFEHLCGLLLDLVEVVLQLLEQNLGSNELSLLGALAAQQF